MAHQGLKGMGLVGLKECAWACNCLHQGALDFEYIGRRITIDLDEDSLETPEKEQKVQAKWVWVSVQGCWLLYVL